MNQGNKKRTEGGKPLSFKPPLFHPLLCPYRRAQYSLKLASQQQAVIHSLSSGTNNLTL